MGAVGLENSPLSKVGNDRKSLRTTALSQTTMSDRFLPWTWKFGRKIETSLSIGCRKKEEIFFLNHFIRKQRNYWYNFSLFLKCGKGKTSSKIETPATPVVICNNFIEDFFILGLDYGLRWKYSIVKCKAGPQNYPA